MTTTHRWGYAMLNKMNKQKGLAPILIVILIALGISGFLIYTNYSNNRTKPAISVQPSQVYPTSNGSSESTDSAETANWKTLTCAFKGVDNFSIKYPANWYIAQPSKCSDVYSSNHEEFHIASSMNEGGRDLPPNWKAVFIIFDANGGYLANNQVITSSTTAEDYLRASNITPDFHPNLYTVTKVNTRQIGSKTAYRFEYIVNATLGKATVKGTTGITEWAVRIPSGIVHFGGVSTDGRSHSISEPEEFEAILNSIQL